MADTHTYRWCGRRAPAGRGIVCVTPPVNSPRFACGLLCVAAAAVLATPSQAQQLRTVDVSRQLRDTLPLAVRVDFSAGELALSESADLVLYGMRLTYDPGGGEPAYSFDSAGRVLRVEMSRSGNPAGGDGEQNMQLRLSPGVPLSVDVDLGAARAALDFTDLALTDFSLQAGASDASVNFGNDNSVPMERFEINAGAANVRVTGLGNARARVVQVHVGLGNVLLDYAGGITNDTELDVHMALGNVTVRVPDDVGVRLETSRVLASVDRGGLTERDGAFYSANWATAAHRIQITNRTVFGKFRLVHTAR